MGAKSDDLQGFAAKTVVREVLAYDYSHSVIFKHADITGTSICLDSLSSGRQLISSRFPEDCVPLISLATRANLTLLDERAFREVLALRVT